MEGWKACGRGSCTASNRFVDMEGPLPFASAWFRGDWDVNRSLREGSFGSSASPSLRLQAVQTNVNFESSACSSVMS